MSGSVRRVGLAALALGLAYSYPASSLALPGTAGAIADPWAGPRAGVHLVADCPGEAVAPGMLASYAKGIQRELAIHGYDAGKPDGALGPRTRRAIRRYQRDAHLPADGCAGQQLLDHLNFVLPKVTKPRSAKANPFVIEAQTLLTRRGYHLGPVDGIAGYKTRAAVRRFQEDARLRVDGVADRALVDAINAADPGVRGDRPPPPQPGT